MFFHGYCGLWTSWPCVLRMAHFMCDIKEKCQRAQIPEKFHAMKPTFVPVADHEGGSDADVAGVVLVAADFLGVPLDGVDDAVGVAVADFKVEFVVDDVVGVAVHGKPVDVAEGGLRDSGFPGSRLFGIPDRNCEFR